MQERTDRTGALRGRLSEVGLPEVLSLLRESKRTGVLSLMSSGVRKSVYFIEGRLVFAASSLPQDRLGEVLLRGGRISPDEYLQLSQRIRGGQRLGKALVEGRVLAPKDLWWGIERQVKEIVWSMFDWEDGYFQFEDDESPRKEKITIDLDVETVIIEGIRRADAGGPIRTHCAPLETVLERSGLAPPVTLERHELHVLGLVNGTATVAEICHESEIGEAETRKALHGLLAVNVLRSLGPKGGIRKDHHSAEEGHAEVIELYNSMFRALFRHMSNEVGPIAEIILDKYFRELKEQPGSVFERVRLLSDGSLDSLEIVRNLRRNDEVHRRDYLVAALNELLYAELLAVKRTLGASHESELIHTFQQIRDKATIRTH